MDEWPPSGRDSRPTLWEAFDDAGRAFLEELVRLVDDGAYKEAVQAFLADEVAVALNLGA
jgi:hypothetical protein